MTIRWGEAAQVAPVLWARIGRDSRGNLHLLNGAEDDVQKMEGVHYWKLGGRWYVQQGDLSYYSDDEQDIYGPHSIFFEAHNSLDEMVRQVEYKTGKRASHTS